MPSIVRQVDFTPEPTLSRVPRDDELFVMRAYAHHANHCSRCAAPYESHCQDVPLCEKGNRLAREIVKYLYLKGGKPFSVIDRQQYQRVQVEIPSGCEVIRDLLIAVERGLQFRHSTPLISYDPTYLVTERRSAAPAVKAPSDSAISEPDTDSLLDGQYVTIEPGRTGRRRSRESAYLSTRGSLYGYDEVERRERSPRIRVRRYRV
ncbi:hypothetical protein FQN54_001478 [Arachnomyces sp. PD_36]|nr:hypothetical protein FQN54_001478 [Arachnomyces sp. PD_36]